MVDPTQIYDANADLRAPCSCGQHGSQREHDHHIQQTKVDHETLGSNAIESAMVRALFPDDRARRGFLKAVGANTAMAAIASVLPIGSMQALAQDKRAPEKKNLKIGFIPITCATPLILAHPLRYYAAEGLEVDIIKTAGWALVRDKVLNKEYDASHFLAPMPIAISLGLGSTQQAMNVATIQNINGQAIILALKHKDKRDPRQWKDFKLGIPFEFSIHNFLLRYYLAEHGIDPDKDVQLRVLAPPELVANLRAGNIEGFLGPDPFNQRAVFEEIGFIHILSKELWDGHPCCSFGAPTAFIKENPNSFAALFRAVLKGAALTRSGQPQDHRRIDCAGKLSESAGRGAGASADRQIR